MTASVSSRAQSATPGTALSFNGTNQCASGTFQSGLGSLSLSNSSFTIEFWAAHTRTGSVDAAVSDGGVLASNKFLFIGFQSANTFGFSFFSNDLTTAAAYTDTNWHHWACTFNNTNLARKIFRDGVLVAGDTANGSFTGTNFFVVARGLGANYFAGALDEVRVWNIERTTNQIEQFMNRSLPGTESGIILGGLALYWRFDEGTGITVKDSSYNNHRGSLSNAPAWVNSGALFAPFPAALTFIPVGSNTLTLLTTVVPNSAPAVAWFQWGTTTNYGNLTMTTNLAAGTNAVPVSVTVSNLTPAFFYHFQAVASNSFGVTFGPDQFSHAPGNFLVTNLAADGPGTLRQLISNSVSGDVITITNHGTITLANSGFGSSQLVISNNLTINGPGAANLSVNFLYQNGYGGARIFFINSGVTANISGISICNGYLLGDPNGSGGGVYNAGTLTLTGCVISNNLAEDTAILNASGTRSGANGGGVFNTGNLTMNFCVVTGNSAGRGSDGPSGTSTGVIGGSGGNGGGIYNNATLTLTACTIIGNSGGAGGHGIDGYGNITFYAGSGGDGGNGGGIYNNGSLTLAACTILGNAGGTAGFFNGISNVLTGTAAGGGGNGGNGGGIYNASNLIMTNCTVADNGAAPGGNTTPGAYTTIPGVGGNGGSGGGIFSTGTLSVVACTITGNSSGGPGMSFLGGTNGVSGAGGGVANIASGPSANLDSSLTALNTSIGSGPDLLGPFSSQGHNVVGQQDDSAGFTNGVNSDSIGTTVAPVNPMIGTLTNNGGPTLTCALLLGSPALEAGDDSLTNTVATDQRGLARLSGVHIDAGAYEFNRATVPNPSVATLPSATPTNNGSTATASTGLNAMVNPGGLMTTVFFQYGLTTAYGGATAPVPVGFGTNTIFAGGFINGLSPGITYHYRAAAANNMGYFYGSDLSFTVPLFFAAGDLNGDGVVDQSELNAVQSNYWQTSALYMTNPATLGQGFFEFELTNAPVFSILVSTNLSQWNYLGPAYQSFQFYDPQAASNAPQRFYRLRYP